MATVSSGASLSGSRKRSDANAFADDGFDDLASLQFRSVQQQRYFLDHDARKGIGLIVDERLRVFCRRQQVVTQITQPVVVVLGTDTEQPDGSDA